MICAGTSGSIIPGDAVRSTRQFKLKMAEEARSSSEDGRHGPLHGRPDEPAIRYHAADRRESLAGGRKVDVSSISCAAWSTARSTPATTAEHSRHWSDARPGLILSEGFRNPQEESSGTSSGRS